MAGSKMILLLAESVMLATVFCLAHADSSASRTFTFYNQAGKEEPVFKASENSVKGSGYVYSETATKTEDPDSEKYASISGMYFYVDKTVVQDVGTITFVDIGKKGGEFADAELHLRSQWYLTKSGEDEPKQTASIVGGSKGLTGAYGSVTFTKKTDSAWLVEGSFLLDNPVYAMH